MNPSNRPLWIKLATVLAIVVLPATAVAADRGKRGGGSKPKAPIAGGLSRSEPANFDVRERARGNQRSSRTRKAQTRLRRSIGPRGVVQVDPVTGTPRFVANQDGFLTGRQSGSARQIALRYLRRHAD